MPLADASVDVVISNCVINLAGDKSKVLAEAARVLRPGGPLRRLRRDRRSATWTTATRADMAAWTGCIAGALTEAEFRGALEAAGFEDDRDPRDPPRARARRLGDHPRAQAVVATR